MDRGNALGDVQVGRYAQRAVKRYGAATGRDLHTDGPLSNIVTAYRPQNLIADELFPVVTVNHETDIFYQWSKADFLRVERAERARGSAANVITMGVNSTGYVAREFSLRMDVPLQDIANADDALSLRETNANYVKDKLLLAYEDRVAVLVGNTSNVGTNTSIGGTGWDDPATTPIDTINNMLEAIRQGTGYEANLWVLDNAVYRRLSKHPDIIDFIRGRGDNTGGGFVKPQALADAFGIERILLGKGIKNTVAEDGVAAFTDIWSTTCLFAYVAPAPGKMIPTYGYTFRWTPPDMPAPFSVERYNLQEKHVEVSEISHYQDERIIGTDLAALILGG